MPILHQHANSGVNDLSLLALSSESGTILNRDDRGILFPYTLLTTSKVSPKPQTPKP